MPKFFTDLGVLRTVRMTFNDQPYLQIYGETTDDLGREIRLTPSINPIELDGPNGWVYQIQFDVNEDAVNVRMIWYSSEPPVLVSFPQIFDFTGAALFDAVSSNVNGGRGARGALSVNENVDSDGGGTFITRRGPGSEATRYAWVRVFKPDNITSLASFVQVLDPSAGTAEITHNVYAGPGPTERSPFIAVELFGGVATFSRLDVDTGRPVPLGTPQVVQPTAAELAVSKWTLGLEFGRIADTFTGYIFPTGGGRISVDVSTGPSDELFFTKSRDWRTEVEYRFVLITDDEEPHYVDVRNALRGVVMGAEVDLGHLRDLQGLCKRLDLRLFGLPWLNGQPRLIAIDVDGEWPPQ